MKINWHKLLSRKFWAVLTAVILPIYNATQGQPIDVDHLFMAVGALLTYIAVEGIIDHKAVKNGNGPKANLSGNLKKALDDLHTKVDALKPQGD